MAMGTRRHRQQQEELWLSAASLAVPASHPFYERLNRLLDECQFDDFVERLCKPFYAETLGRPGLAPGIYFRLLMVGYFEGIDSERGIAWRAADSLGIRKFLRVALDETAPDHSTISRTRRLIDEETHRLVFVWLLQVLAERGLLRGHTIGIDATTLEANAALRSIVRRDTGEQYEEFLRRLAQESGIETPTRAQLTKLDKKRARKGSNEDWTHPHDPDARITKMKDGRTHLAHKAEHAVDMESGAVVAVTVQPADAGDTQTVQQTLAEAQENIGVVVEAIQSEPSAAAVQVESPAELSPTRAITVERWYGRWPRPEFAPIFRNPSAADNAGGIKVPSRLRYMRIGDGSTASAASDYSGNEARSWSAPWRTCTKPGACGECTYAGTTTSSSGYSYMRAV
jgi:transposase